MPAPGGAERRTAAPSGARARRRRPAGRPPPPGTPPRAGPSLPGWPPGARRMPAPPARRLRYVMLRVRVRSGHMMLRMRVPMGGRPTPLCAAMASAHCGCRPASEMQQSALWRPGRAWPPVAAGSGVHATVSNTSDRPAASTLSSCPSAPPQSSVPSYQAWHAGCSPVRRAGSGLPRRGLRVLRRGRR